MRFTTSLLWLLAIGAATACLPSLSCTLGGFACNNLCVREVGRGGHCEPNDQCPGNQICVCDPATKRSEQRQEKINGEAGFIAAFEKLIDTPDVERREATVNDETRVVKRGTKQRTVKKATEDKAIEARSICCSFPNPIGGLCCDDHCSKIGKPGGQCTTNDGSTVCVCN